MKRCVTILLALLVLTACAAGGGAPTPGSESDPSSASEPSSVLESVPAPDQPPQAEINPDFGWGPEDERVNQLIGAVQDDLLPRLPETSYSYLTLYQDGSEVVLKIGVVDEAAVDACLAAWTGERWDRLVKEPALYSRAIRSEFVERAEQLDFGPDVKVMIGTFPPMWGNENVVFGVMITVPESLASREEIKLLEEMPQQLLELAEEMNIPEDVIDYSFGYIIETFTPLPGSEPPVG